ncbi:FecR family protein [Chitinophaga sp. CF118]|uniref:FecR family protein n=1 Tax=Chitinophaga sp. CF118 TaxID=1884367 RepID=UPI0008EC0B72|nr:FecR family protein [Chitinophaga sp. CF118]SFE40764.1 FecR family protein [Chitinophaga sp. CF118]
MSIERIKELFELFEADRATPAQERELFQLLENFREEALVDYLVEDLRNTTPVAPLEAHRWQHVLQKVLKSGKRPVYTMKKWLVAAAVAILVAGTVYFFLPRKEHVITVSNKPADIAPGGNKAILTLADGSVVTLDSAQHTLPTQGAALVRNGANGELLYQAQGGVAENVFNTLSTPRGGQYQLTLSDGSKVWLNASSSIRFPAAFTGNKREVTITGEVYFEVALKADAPFRVIIAGGNAVEVLGTSFNINAYGEEVKLKTTLLTGAVKVIHENNSQLLKPGQQAQLNKQEQLQVINGADLDAVMAWKNGLFNFSNADLQEVMRQLERWYDITVVYEGNIPQRQFNGEMERNLQLSQVLNILKKSNVNFRVEGRKLVVMP